MPIPDAGVIAVAGEAIVDLVAAGPGGPYLALPGGSPANVAVGVARLGAPAEMIARLGDDPFGRTLRGHLARNGVGTGAVVTAAEPSSVAFVHHDDARSPAFDLRIAGTADWQWTAAELADLPGDGVVALHTGSLAMVMPPGAEALEALVRRARATATISYDPNCRPDVMARVPGARSRIEALMRTADIVKVSDADLAWLRPGEDPERFAAGLLASAADGTDHARDARDAGPIDGDAGRHGGGRGDRGRGGGGDGPAPGTGPSLVAVTLGAAGAIVAGRRMPPRPLPAYPVEVVDTVGAGDSYMSALLAGLHARGLLGAGRRAALASAPAADLVEVCADAARAAALTCGRRGADPPTRAELDGARPARR